MFSDTVVSIQGLSTLGKQNLPYFNFKPNFYSFGLCAYQLLTPNLKRNFLGLI